MEKSFQSSLESLQREIRIYDLYALWNDTLSDHWFASDDAPASIGASGPLYESIIHIQDALGTRLNRKKKCEFIMDLLGEQWHLLRQSADIHAVAIIESLGKALMDWAEEA